MSWVIWLVIILAVDAALMVAVALLDLRARLRRDQ